MMDMVFEKCYWELGMMGCGGECRGKGMGGGQMIGEGDMVMI